MKKEFEIFTIRDIKWLIRSWYHRSYICLASINKSRLFSLRQRKLDEAKKEEKRRKILQRLRGTGEFFKAANELSCLSTLFHALREEVFGPHNQVFNHA